ncbi:MAG: hypothetical protein WD079_04670, partial [Phycisphaeraceae bacterium]
PNINIFGYTLLPGTEFRTFQYVHAWMLPAAVQFRRRMTRRFGPPRVSRPVLRNLPPAVVLTWGRPAVVPATASVGAEAGA